MEKKIFIGWMAVIAVMLIAGTLVVVGCGLLKDHSAEIHQTVATALQKAYDNGGAEKVGDKIDSLVAEGKLSQLQAEKLKEALQKGYDSLQSKLAELSEKDSPADTKAE